MRRSAIIGGVFWLALAALFGPGRGFYRTIELMFLLGPLVIVPMGLELAGNLERAVRMTQPVGALCAVAAFAIPTGWPAAIVALPWLLVTVLIGWSGLVRIWRGEFRDPAKACLIAAMLFVPVGGMGFVQSRYGATPLGDAEPVVLLLGVHFHFTGFALPILAGLAIARGKVTRAGRFTASGVVGATPVVAVGFLFRWPLVKVAGALWLVMSLLVLSLLMLALLAKIRPRVAQVLLAVSALSMIAGMALAGLYAVGEFLGKDFITIPRMAMTHGLLNGLGFCLCGLAGWTVAQCQAGLSSRRMTLRTLTGRWTL